MIGGLAAWVDESRIDGLCRYLEEETVDAWAIAARGDPSDPMAETAHRRSRLGVQGLSRDTDRHRFRCVRWKIESVSLVGIE